MADRVYLTGAHVFDGSGNKPLAQTAVVVEENRIANVLSESSLPSESSALRIELPAGTTLLPGLIDMHLHLSDWGSPAEVLSSPILSTIRTAANARLTQKAGITTVRDVGAAYGVAIAVRDAIAAGEIEGSRVFAAGHLIAMTGGHGTEVGDGAMCAEVTGVIEARRQVRLEAKAGADLIKLALDGRRMLPGKHVVEFTQEEVDAIVDEAHRLGLKVAAHVFYPETATMACRAGVDTLEHGLELDEENVREIADAGIVLVPTCRLSRHILDLREALIAASPYGAQAVRHAEMGVKNQKRSVPLAMAAGVTIVAGTDTSSFAGGIDSLVSELEYFVEFGMKPTEALLSATSISAGALGQAGNLGVVSAGAFADILVCKGDPTENISALRDVVLVIQNGHMVVGCLKWEGQRGAPLEGGSRRF